MKSKILWCFLALFASILVCDASLMRNGLSRRFSSDNTVGRSFKEVNAESKYFQPFSDINNFSTQRLYNTTFYLSKNTAPHSSSSLSWDVMLISGAFYNIVDKNLSDWNDGWYNGLITTKRKPSPIDDRMYNINDVTLTFNNYYYYHTLGEVNTDIQYFEIDQINTSLNIHLLNSKPVNICNVKIYEEDGITLFTSDFADTLNLNDDYFVGACDYKIDNMKIPQYLWYHKNNCTKWYIVDGSDILNHFEIKSDYYLDPGFVIKGFVKTKSYTGKKLILRYEY